jgi:hypothetical protein
MSQQTVLELVISQLKEHITKSAHNQLGTNRTGDYRIGLVKAIDFCEQAKELEKQQKQKYLMAILDCKNLLKEINKTATVGQTQINIKIFELENILNAEQYYNETYKTKKP